MDGIQIDDKLLLLSSLTRACKLENDHVKNRFPIRVGLLEMILFELERLYVLQPYLEALFKALFAIAYYGLFRIGELTDSEHTVKAKDVYVGDNKNKIMMILYSSKTHGPESRPQEVRISEMFKSEQGAKFFCPFRLMRLFWHLRGSFDDSHEFFFIFRDGSKVTPTQARDTLRTVLQALNLDGNLHDFHSFRIRRASDMYKWNFPLSEIKFSGRWKTNVVFKYIRNCQ